jgi:uncharacterized BrkB/YihY/UPF0761 family membrane protein
MRWLLLAGSIVFAYLALVPGGLLLSVADSACAGPDCDQPLAEDLVLGVLYGLCFAAMVACSGAMTLYFFRTTVSGERLIRRALLGAVAAVGLTLLAHFALAFPFAALATFGIGGAVYGTLRYLNAPRKPKGPDPSRNGHGSLNGHAG